MRPPAGRKRGLPRLFCRIHDSTKRHVFWNGTCICKFRCQKRLLHERRFAHAITGLTCLLHKVSPTRVINTSAATLCRRGRPPDCIDNRESGHEVRAKSGLKIQVAYKRYIYFLQLNRFSAVLLHSCERSHVVLVRSICVQVNTASHAA